MASAQTGPDGTYFIAQLPVGVYDLTVDAQGFKKYIRRQITLDVAAKA